MLEFKQMTEDFMEGRNESGKRIVVFDIHPVLNETSLLFSISNCATSTELRQIADKLDELNKAG